MSLLSKWYTSNSPLPQKQMEHNATLVYEYFTEKVTPPWNPVAIAGMLGNMQAESTINPGRWENGEINNLDAGYGLVQWTPASKYINWAGSSFSNGDRQCARIDYERANGLQWTDYLVVMGTTVNADLGIPTAWVDSKGDHYPVEIEGIYDFDRFAYGDKWPIVNYPGIYVPLDGNVRYAAWAFMYQYERPRDYNQPWRADYAEQWADYFGIPRKANYPPLALAGFSFLTKRKKLLKERKDWAI